MNQEQKFDEKEECNKFAAFLKKYLESRPMNKFGKKNPVVFNDEYKHVIKQIVLYFNNRPEFEALGEDFSLKKGLWIYGPAGSRKTSLMQAVRLYFSRIQSFQIVSCRDIQWQYTQKGYDAITLYGKKSYAYNYFKGFDRSNGFLVYCFDDFGAEDRSKNFGNDAKVMEEILQDRYVEMQETGMITHVTSNLGKNGDRIEAEYGTRVRSRIREMFNMIELNDGVDYRK